VTQWEGDQMGWNGGGGYYDEALLREGFRDNVADTAAATLLSP